MMSLFLRKAFSYLHKMRGRFIFTLSLEQSPFPKEPLHKATHRARVSHNTITMGKRCAERAPVLIEPDREDPSEKKRRVDTSFAQDSAAMTLLSLRSDTKSSLPLPKGWTYHETNSSSVTRTHVRRKFSQSSSSSRSSAVTDDEDECKNVTGIALRRSRYSNFEGPPIRKALSSPKLFLLPRGLHPGIPLNPQLPVGRPLAAPPTLRLPTENAKTLKPLTMHF